MCVTGQFTEELARASPNSELEIRDWILWSALAPAQRVVNGQFDTKYHISGSRESLENNYQTGITSITRWWAWAHEPPGLQTLLHCYMSPGPGPGHWPLVRPSYAGTSCQDSSGVWSIPKYELNYRMNFSWAWPCTTLSLSLSIRSSQSTNNISLSANEWVKIILYVYALLHPPMYLNNNFTYVVYNIYSSFEKK